MKIEKFEDLEIWKDAREICRIVNLLVQQPLFSKDYKLRDQIRNSSGSIMDNIAEGFGRGGNREFIQFLSIAKGSNDETRSQSYRAFDLNYITEDQLNEMIEKTDKLSRKMSNLIQYLKNSTLKGSKF
jgi:four helix bundle protein